MSPRYVINIKKNSHFVKIPVQCCITKVHAKRVSSSTLQTDRHKDNVNYRIYYKNIYLKAGSLVFLEQLVVRLVDKRVVHGSAVARADHVAQGYVLEA